MASGIGKSDAPAEHDSGVGRIRERTVSIGDTLIAIDSIGSIQILDVRRNWALARLGAFVAAGGAAVMMMPSNPYSYGGSGGSPGQMIGLALVGVGLAMIVGNWLQPLRKGLGIGTSDGRISYLISEDHAFLHRLLEFLTQKINTRNEGLTASFDITHNTFNTNGGGVVIGADGVASGAGGHAAGAESAISITNNAAPPPPVFVAAPAPPLPSPPTPLPPPPPTAIAPIDPDEALFADEPQAVPPPVALKARVEPPNPVVAVATAARTRPRDPLLDGPETTARDDNSPDWLSAPGRIGYSSAPEGGGARWLLPLVLLLVGGGGSFAGWYFYSQSEAAKSSSLMPAAGEPPPAAAESASAPPSEALPTPALIEDASVLPAEAPAGPAPTELGALDNSTPAPEATPFTPSEMIVARASGLRYRARPSSADDVPILAETRAGGEGLLVTGITTQPDGDWYQVTLEDGRSAWFKASLTVQRSRFAETFAISALAPSLSFAAASPRVLEPAEGVQLPGGAQPVRLAWQGPANASGFVVEIEAYDATARRWIENPVHKRLSVESAEELAELIPRTGAWRWRVRGVSASGEQSQFSRWAAFGLRN